MSFLRSCSSASLRPARVSPPTAAALLCSCTLVRSFASAPAPSPSTPVTPPPSRGFYELPNGLLLKGQVIRTGKMKHTSTVSVERKVVDHKTLKEFKQHTRYLIHDPDHLCVVGDLVSIRNCRPVSKSKRFELVQVLKGARERVENMQAVQEAEEEQVKEMIEEQEAAAAAAAAAEVEASGPGPQSRA